MPPKPERDDASRASCAIGAARNRRQRLARPPGGTFSRPEASRRPQPNQPRPRPGRKESQTTDGRNEQRHDLTEDEQLALRAVNDGDKSVLDGFGEERMREAFFRRIELGLVDKSAVIALMEPTDDQPFRLLAARREGRGVSTGQQAAPDSVALEESRVAAPATASTAPDAWSDMTVLELLGTRLGRATTDVFVATHFGCAPSSNRGDERRRGSRFGRRSPTRSQVGGREA